jgi:hypothetical protein
MEAQSRRARITPGGVTEPDLFPRASEFGLGLRARIEAREPAVADVLSPELVLVMPPEEARRARELLTDPPPPPERRPPAPGPRRRIGVGVLAFAAFSILDTVGPLAFALIHLRR